MKMEDSELDAILNDFSPIGSSDFSADPELRLVAAAIYLEETVGVSLSDEEIAAENLGSGEAMRRFARRKAGA